jgi:hypothetical protein
MWLNGTIENDSPASGVCSERLHGYHCFLFFCHCHKQEIESLYATATRCKKSTGHRSAKDGTHIRFESCECMFSAPARFLEFEVEGAQKKEGVMVYCLFWH